MREQAAQVRERQERFRELHGTAERCENETCGRSFIPANRLARFCSSKCRYQARDRRRQAENREAVREKSRRYYQRNREKFIARATARHRRGKS